VDLVVSSLGERTKGQRLDAAAAAKPLWLPRVHGNTHFGGIVNLVGPIAKSTLDRT
jgi:hypothetical protein